MITKIGLYKDSRKQRPWVVRWFGEYAPATGKQKRYSKSFVRKRDAEEFQSKMTMEFKEGQQRDKPEEVTLKEFCKEWLNVRKIEFQPSTIAIYENATARLLDYFGNNMLLSDITAFSATKFISELHRLDGKEGGLSDWSRHRTLRNCKTMFEAAVDWGLIGKNPFACIKRPKLVQQNWHYMTPAEFKQLLAASNGKHNIPLRWKVTYALAYCCGLRLGEILNLRWDDIHCKEPGSKSGHVREAEIKIQSRPATATTPPFVVKDKEARTIPVPKLCLALLIDLKSYNEMTDQTPYVVLNEQQYRTVLRKWKIRQKHKKPWFNRDMQNNTLSTFKRHIRWAKIEPDESLSLHTLRKCCITNWANSITNPEVVRVLAGHFDLKTTMQYYCQVDKEQKAKATAAIDNLLKTN